MLLEAPAPGTLGWELIDVAIAYSGAREFAKLAGDKLEVLDCEELGRRISNVVEDFFENGRVAHVYLSGNDFRYIVGRIATSFGLPERPDMLELMKTWGGLVEEKGCVAVLEENFAVPAMLNLNFYEYGRSFLRKPEKKLRPKEKVSGLAVLLGLLGGMMAYSGRVEANTFYFLPNKDVINAVRFRDVTRRYALLAGNDYPDFMITLLLALRLIEWGFAKVDVEYGRMASLQEGQRPTLMSVASMHTAGVVRMVSSIAGSLNIKAESAARSIYRLLASPLELRRGSKERNAVMTFVERFSSYLLAYALTESPESLALAVSLLDRVASEIELGSSSELARGLREWASRRELNPKAELVSLASMLSGARARVP